jgi:hypothetical protein
LRVLVNAAMNFRIRSEDIVWEKIGELIALIRKCSRKEVNFAGLVLIEKNLTAALRIGFRSSQP